jgi:archaellum biogenesis protein FlaJ (TadC family)
MLVSYPLFLLALLALVIPLVLHFWGIRMYKKVYMSSIALLQKVKIETNTTQHIKRLLLLAARLSLLAFLVLAFAQPLWKDEVPIRAVCVPVATKRCFLNCKSGLSN